MTFARFPMHFQPFKGLEFQDFPAGACSQRSLTNANTHTFVCSTSLYLQYDDSCIFFSQSTDRGSQIAAHMREEFEELLVTYRVNLAFWGHYHSYERTCPVSKERCTPGAPTHIVVGTGGFILQFYDPWSKKDWSMYHALHYGYGRVAVANQSAMLFEWVRNSDGQVADHVWIYQWPDANPFTPESDQSPISPATSPKISHHTVWRTWLFIAYRWKVITLQFSLPHPYISLWEGWENVLFELGSERANCEDLWNHVVWHKKEWTSIQCSVVDKKKWAIIVCCKIIIYGEKANKIVYHGFNLDHQ